MKPELCANGCGRKVVGKLKYCEVCRKVLFNKAMARIKTAPATAQKTPPSDLYFNPRLCLNLSKLAQEDKKRHKSAELQTRVKKASSPDGAPSHFSSLPKCTMPTVENVLEESWRVQNCIGKRPEIFLGVSSLV